MEWKAAYSSTLIFLFCLLTAGSKGQSTYVSNKFFIYNYDISNFKEFSESELNDFNTKLNKSDWNRYCGGIYSNEQNIVILFQMLKINKTIKSIDDYFSQLKSFDYRSELDKRGKQEVLIDSFFIIKSIDAICTHSHNSMEFWQSFTFFCTKGLINLKIFSPLPINYSTLKYAKEIKIKNEYVGFPKETFWGDIKWEDVILKGITSALSPKIKLPIKSKN